MRILHVIGSVGDAHGGPSTAVKLMARASAAAGMTVHIATTNINGDGYLDVPFDEPVNEGGASIRYFRADTRFYSTSRSLARWLRERTGDYDVVHAHALFSFPTTMAARHARRSARPYILRPLGTLAPYGMTQHRLLKRVSWELLESRIIPRAKALHFTSVAERDEAEGLGIDFRSEVVPLGIDVAEYQTTRDRAWLKNRGGAEDSGCVFLFMSRLHEKKRLELVLSAIAELNRDGRTASLIVAGHGESRYVDSLKALAQQLGIREAVVWAGHVSGEEKRAVLRAADVFVLPSINENFGIAVIEACASGLPCVLTSGVAVHREVEAVDAGIIVGGSTAAVAEAMRALLDPATRMEMAGRARALAETAFSLDAMSRGLTAMYQRAVA
ncbi:MAG TPA: glycosyltransferase [Longimicrobiales bacterium]|nr:glycosyltransferase [Longimicrobiales bacterium]